MSGKVPKPTEGQIAWFELFTKDPWTSLNFYTSSLKWGYQPPPVDTSLLTADITVRDPKGFGGSIVDDAKNAGTGFIVYYYVDTIEEATARIVKNGGKVVLVKTEQGTWGWYSILTDPDGNRFGIYELNPDRIQS
jgi:uncharacterized protein